MSGGRPSDRQTDRQTNRQAGKQTDTYTKKNVWLKKLKKQRRGVINLVLI